LCALALNQSSVEDTNKIAPETFNNSSRSKTTATNKETPLPIHKASNEYEDEEAISRNFESRGFERLSMECTVHTTIEVERLFSLVNVTKTNKRDKMKTQTLEALMTVKKNLPRIQDFCTNFPDILSKAVVTKLTKDNNHVQQASNHSEIDADSQGSVSGNESLISFDDSESENEMDDGHHI